ncbi:MAG: RNA polymerase sigma-70 factor [Chitinophagaceae bacterium]
MKNYEKYENQVLLSLVSRNDKIAFTELYNRFWQPLFAIAINRTKEKETAEDIVHDVFAGLWANRTKIQIESLENYLAVAVKYAVFNKIKKKVRERELQYHLEGAKLVEMKVEDAIYYKRILELVKQEVERLPEKCRLVFKCSREAGMPVNQIAAELNISPKTVENQLTKAIRQLRLATRSFFHSFF